MVPGEKCWFYSAVVGSGPAEFLIDSEAEITLLDIAVFKSIRDGPTLKPCDVQLSVANGRQIEVFGEVLLPITLDSVTVEHHTVVCNLSGKIGITDHRNGTLHMSDYNKTLVLHRKVASLCARVTIARVLVIPPRSEMIVPGVADNRRWSESIGLIESSNQLSKHGPVMLAKSLVSTEHGEVPLCIANVGEEPIVLQRGTVAAIIHIFPMEYNNSLSVVQDIFILLVKTGLCLRG